MAKHTVPNLAQGVSQQSAQQRRDTQCEEQFDMLNHAVEGATARPGFDLVKKLDSDDNEGAFFYDIIRDQDERYTVIIKDGTLRIINFLTGTECTVNELEDVSSYLAAMPEGTLDRDGWCATTGEDDTYIANKTIAPQMGTVTSDERPPEALFWFRAGGYKVTYQISIKFDGTWYNWAYQTPDNSVAGNAEYITTDHICYALYNAMVTDPTYPITGLGFSIARSGNIMRLWRTDGEPFDIETMDGNNNTQLSGLKDRVGGLENVPQNGFHGMAFKVAGAEDADADDWYIQFDSTAEAGDSTTQGAWVETVKPDTVLNLAYATMPLLLFNTGLNTFDLSFGSWGNRISGDGVESAPDPSFVGKTIEDIAFDQRRLNITTKGSTVWSRTNQGYVFFPDTARAGLPTAPIDARPRVTQGIAILNKIVQASGFTFLWAEGIQLAVTHNTTQAFSNASIEINPSTAFEWNTKIRPVSIGRWLLFTTALGNYSSFTDVEFQQGQVVDDEDIAEHVPEYIPADLLEMVASYTAKKVVAIAGSTPNILYLYEYRRTRNEGRVQSAWNKWRLPKGCTLLHVLFDKTDLLAYVKRAEGTFLVRLSVAPRRKDAVSGARYLTRLDFRVTEAQCDVIYDEETDTTEVILPYAADDEMEFDLFRDNLSVMFVVRANSGEYKRGQDIRPMDVNVAGDETSIILSGDYTDVPFYAGFRIQARRRESLFYRRSDEGYVYIQNIVVSQVVLTVAGTGYTRYELSNPRTNQTIKVEEFEGRRLGDVNNVTDQAIISGGDFECGVGEDNEEAVVDWINDSFLPSSWVSVTWYYNPSDN